MICIFLMIKDVDHLFVCLLVTWISSLEKCLFKSFVQVLIRLSFLLLSCRHSVCILDINPLSHTRFTNIFSLSLFSLPSPFSLVSLWSSIYLAVSFVKFCLPSFFLLLLRLLSYPSNHYPNPNPDPNIANSNDIKHFLYVFL